MERHFRIVVSMLLLIVAGYQARPVCTNLPFKLLKESLNCTDNVTFTSPTNVQNHCHNTAMKTFKEGLEHARVTCTDELERISDTLYDLEICIKGTQLPQDTSKTSEECTWEKKQSAGFLTDFENYIQLVNSIKANKN